MIISTEEVTVTYSEILQFKLYYREASQLQG